MVHKAYHGQSTPRQYEGMVTSTLSIGDFWQPAGHGISVLPVLEIECRYWPNSHTQKVTRMGITAKTDQLGG